MVTRWPSRQSKDEVLLVEEVPSEAMLDKQLHSRVALAGGDNSERFIRS